MTQAAPFDKVPTMSYTVLARRYRSRTFDEVIGQEHVAQTLKRTNESHMLSKSSFNALLKTLEEPPEHVKFILATTEPEKLLPTILSRCQRYDFRNIPTREIADHLANICKQEKIKADEDALLLVAKAGDGSMPDSLSLLDRLLRIGEKQLTIETIEQLLAMPTSEAI